MKQFLSIILIFMAISTACAVEITTTEAGVLANMPAEEAATITELSIAGPINASDLHFVASLPAITSLNLSKAQIVEETNTRLATNTAHYPAGHLPAYILSGARFKSIILPEGLTTIEAGALMSTAIESITIPATVTTIGRGALADCRSLVSLTIPAGVTSIGTHLCDGATALTSVTFHATDVPAQAFRGCTALKSFQGSPVTIGAGAFAGCESLKEFPFTAQITTIGDNAFFASGLATAIFPSAARLTSVGDYAFAACPELKEVNLPSSLKSLGEGAFFGDESLTLLVVPGSIDTIADFTFTSLKSIADASGLLPEGITSIGRYAMAGMNSATSVKIPSSLSSIGEKAMSGMTSLATIDAKESTQVPATGENVWHGIDPTRVILYVQPEMEQLFATAPQWQDFTIISASIDEVNTDTPRPGADIRLWLTANTLSITSPSGITAVTIHDIYGRRLLYADTAGAEDVTLGIENISPQVIIITVDTPQGAQTFKTAR